MLVALTCSAPPAYFLAKLDEQAGTFDFELLSSDILGVGQNEITAAGRLRPLPRRIPPGRLGWFLGLRAGAGVSRIGDVGWSW
jgi:hypothetical protein